MTRVVFCVSLLVVWPVLASAQSPADQDLRVGISELCTVCNDVVRCERDDSAPDGPPVVVYNLLEDDIWQQMATIWDYLIQFISTKTDDVRAMTIYELQSPDDPAPRVITAQEATVDGAALSIRLPGDTVIDQRTGRWFQIRADGGELELGRCELLEFAAGRDLLKTLKTIPQGE